MFLTGDVSTQVGTMALVPQVVTRKVRLSLLGIADARGSIGGLCPRCSGGTASARLTCVALRLKSARSISGIEGAKAIMKPPITNYSQPSSTSDRESLHAEVGQCPISPPEFPLVAAALAPLRRNQRWQDLLISLHCGRAKAAV